MQNTGHSWEGPRNWTFRNFTMDHMVLVTSRSAVTRAEITRKGWTVQLVCSERICRGQSTPGKPGSRSPTMISAQASNGNSPQMGEDLGDMVWHSPIQGRNGLVTFLHTCSGTPWTAAHASRRKLLLTSVSSGGFLLLAVSPQMQNPGVQTSQETTLDLNFWKTRCKCACWPSAGTQGEAARRSRNTVYFPWFF